MKFSKEEMRGKGLSQKVFYSLIILILIISCFCVIGAVDAVSVNKSQYHIAWVKSFSGDTFINDLSWSPNSNNISITRGYWGHNLIILDINGTEMNMSNNLYLSPPYEYLTSEWVSNSGLLLASYEGPLVKMNITTGEKSYIRQPYPLDGSYYHISFNANKEYLAFKPTYYGDQITDSNIYYNGTNRLHGPIEIINLSTNQTLSIINIYGAFSEQSTTFEISPSGEKIAMVLDNGNVVITNIDMTIDNLDLNTTSHTFTLLNDSRSIKGIAWSPDDSKIATIYNEVSGNNTNPTSNLSLWNTSDGTKIKDLVIDDAHWLVSVNWNEKNSLITSAESQESGTLNTIYILNGTDYSFIQNISHKNLNEADLRLTPGDLETSPDGEYIVVTYGSTLVMLEKNGPDWNSATMYSSGAIIAPSSVLVLILVQRKMKGRQ
ncbi:MAG: hypothetical protein PHU53_00550 [Thermoplasmata archaeon]|nr:hypothetical protein [Thermoplasmata archaeon]